MFEIRAATIHISTLANGEQKQPYKSMRQAKISQRADRVYADIGR